MLESVTVPVTNGKKKMEIKILWPGMIYRGNFLVVKTAIIVTKLLFTSYYEVCQGSIRSIFWPFSF